MDYVGVLHRGIEALVERFQQNPFDFLYERDLQAMLFGLLVAEFGDERIEMKGGYLDVREYGGSDTVRTVPVKCEYLRAFDIAIIDPETLRPYDKAEWEAKGLKSDAFWNQPVLAAVELKYCQLGHERNRKRGECNEDVGKLRRYRDHERSDRPFLGISLLFIQSDTVDPKFFFDGAEFGEERKTGLARYVVTRRGWWRFSV